MEIIADLHMHSKYSRATSPKMNIIELSRAAKVKGIDVLGTGDFLHPVWLKDLKENLEKSAEGVYQYGGTNFVLTNEVSLMYRQDNKGRRVHHIILCPDFETLDQIREYFGKKGRLDYDGRPIFGINSIEMTESLMQISKDIEIIPAHCLVPGEFIHTNPDIKKIEEIKKGDKVLTHRGNFKKVTELYKRPYSGKVLKVVPWYFSNGTTVTPEHPFLAIKTDKNCSWTKDLICKPTESHKRVCHSESYKKYKKEWVMAGELEKGDVIIYPKLKDIQDQETIKVNDFEIPINSDFCRLSGYYLAEGYTNSRDALCFTFNNDEIDLTEDVKNIIKKIFGLEAKKGKTVGDLIFYSKDLMKVFQELFYKEHPYKAQNKALPHWMLKLPLEKQKEILIGWWKGDRGYTISRLLANQMKIICLRMNIIPSIRIDKISDFLKRGKHKLGEREIKANFDLIVLDKLSFLEDKFNLLDDKYFEFFKTKNDIKHAWFDENNLYIPIRKIETFDYNGLVYNMEVEDDNSYVSEVATVHNCWTPWFSVFGSMSGFDTLKDCFGDQMKHIHAIETGLSSDPSMNWRLSQLDDITLISNSDSHSTQPHRLGRECNVFDFKEITYKNILNAIRTRNGFSYTIETDPNYGKYHFDGHRLCKFSCSPQESKKLKKICPVCKKPMTIGVMYRVEELADRKEGYVKKDAVPFKSILPLSEIIANLLNAGVETKKVQDIANKLINSFKSELDVLLNTEKKEISKLTDEKIASAVIKNRQGKLKFIPGYDGVYGKPIFEEQKGLKGFV